MWISSKTFDWLHEGIQSYVGGDIARCGKRNLWAETNPGSVYVILTVKSDLELPKLVFHFQAMFQLASKGLELNVLRGIKCKTFNVESYMEYLFFPTMSLWYACSIFGWASLWIIPTRHSSYPFSVIHSLQSHLVVQYERRLWGEWRECIMTLRVYVGSRSLVRPESTSARVATMNNADGMTSWSCHTCILKRTALSQCT